MYTPNLSGGLRVRVERFNLNDFHLGNWKAVAVEISLYVIHCFEIHSKKRWRLIVVELRHKNRFYLFRLRW